MNDANASTYASTIHWSPDTPVPRLRWMVGSAVLTTRLSSIGMNSPNTIAARTHHLRRSDPVAAEEDAACRVRDICGLLSWG